MTDKAPLVRAMSEQIAELQKQEVDLLARAMSLSNERRRIIRHPGNDVSLAVARLTEIQTELHDLAGVLSRTKLVRRRAQYLEEAEKVDA